MVVDVTLTHMTIAISRKTEVCLASPSSKKTKLQQNHNKNEKLRFLELLRSYS
jgi:hypothetical protein